MSALLKCRWRLGLAFNDFENFLAIKRKADAKLAFVLVKSSLVPADEDRVVLDNCPGSS